jgi:serine/threonine protein kinase
VDQRTDIYALGITAYEMVTGQRPFPENDLLALMDMHLSCDFPDPAEFRSDLPAGLKQFIFKACARDPSGRYANVQQALDDLKPMATDLGLLAKPFPSPKHCMTTLHLFYAEEQQLALKQLIEEFGGKAQEIDVDLRAVDFEKSDTE